MDQDRIAMVVLGMHRSGASAMAGALAASGFRPPSTQTRPRPDDSSSYYQSAAVAALNDEILAAQDASWDDLFPVDEASLLSNFGVFFLGKAAEVLKAEFGDASRIVLKDPRICLLTHVWKRTLSDQDFRAHFILVIRHPGEVAASLARRNEFSRDKSLLLWMSSLISAERKTRDDSRSFVLYEDLLADPQAVLDRIQADFGQPLPRRTRAAGIEVERIVNASLRTHAHEAGLHSKRELNRLAHLAYDGLRSAARGGQLDCEMLDGVARRLAAIEEVAGGVVSELRVHADELSARLHEARTEAQAVAGRLAVLEPLAAQAGTAEGLQTELEGERAVAAILTARVSELTHAAQDAARALEQQHQAARAQADVLAGALAAEREARETQGAELARLLADARARTELDRRLQQARDALAQELATAQVQGQAADVRATALERLLAEAQDAHALQQDALRTEIETLTREVATERTARTREHEGRCAEIAELDDLLKAEREAQARQQTADQAEIERLAALVEVERTCAQAAAERASTLDSHLAEANQRSSELADQTAALRSTLVEDRAAASQALSDLEHRLGERQQRTAASRDAFQAALEVERGESATAKARLEQVVLEVAKVRAVHVETLDQHAADLEGERSALRAMVGDLALVSSHLDSARREAAELHATLQQDRAELRARADDVARLEAALSDDRTQAAHRLEAALHRSSALSTELTSVKEMLAYINRRWWWRAMARVKVLVG